MSELLELVQVINAIWDNPERREEQGKVMALLMEEEKLEQVIAQVVALKILTQGGTNHAKDTTAETRE